MDESQTIRVSIEEAATLLGIEKGSVKKRIQRGKLHSGKDARGVTWVDVDRSETVRDTSQGRSETDRDELVGELRDRVRFLEDQLQQANERDRENRRIVAALTSRIPELEAPQETTEAPETVEEAPEGAEPHPDTVEAQATTQHQRTQRPTECVEHDANTLREWTNDVEHRPQEDTRRPWWRRMFGG